MSAGGYGKHEEVRLAAKLPHGEFDICSKWAVYQKDPSRVEWQFEG